MSSRDEPAIVRVGLLGCGTVGAALAQLLDEERDVISSRTGMRFEIGRVAVRDLARDRGIEVPASAFTTDPRSVVDDPDIDVVVELMGGVEPARSLIMASLALGKPVITANKELLATHGPELFAAAAGAGVDLLFEAAVAGGIPIVRPMRESLLGEPVRRVLGIMNGTTNYILTRMSDEGADFGDVLRDVQALGYAEADPTADVEGLDAAAKLAILASIAFGVEVVADQVASEGIAGITAEDIAFAHRHDFVVKLLAVAERFGLADDSTPEIGVRVHPALVPETHPLAAVRDTFNAVFVEGAAVGDLMFYGRGAGGRPTASAVLGDLIDAATNARRGGHATIGVLGPAVIRPTDEFVSAFYIELGVADRPGVLAAVAGVFGAHKVSISSMEQQGLVADGARLVFVTHNALERDVLATLAELAELDVVQRVGSVIRVLADDQVA